MLLGPLPLRIVMPADLQGGYAEIATVSALFGAVAVGICRLRLVRPQAYTALTL